MKSTPPQREVWGRVPERYSRSGIGRPCRAHVNAPHTDGVLPGLCAAWRLLSHAAPIDSKAVDECVLSPGYAFTLASSPRGLWVANKMLRGGCIVLIG